MRHDPSVVLASDGSCSLLVLFRENSSRSPSISILTRIQAALFGVLFSMICWYVVLLDMVRFSSFENVARNVYSQVRMLATVMPREMNGII